MFGGLLGGFGGLFGGGRRGPRRGKDVVHPLRWVKLNFGRPNRGWKKLTCL